MGTNSTEISALPQFCFWDLRKEEVDSPPGSLRNIMSLQWLPLEEDSSPKP